MYKIGDYVVHKRYVCKIIGIKEKLFNNTDYYELVNVSDPSLSIKVPTNNDSLLTKVMSKDEVEDLLKRIPSIPLIDEVTEKNVENTYRELINSGSKEDLIRIIKSAYIRNENRLKSGKKPGEKDTSYLEMAESTLYNEFSIALNMSYEDAKNYVLKKVSEYDNKR